MVRYNELIIDGVGTSSFPFDVIVLEGPTIQVGLSKDKLLSHDGFSQTLTEKRLKRNTLFNSSTQQSCKSLNLFNFSQKGISGLRINRTSSQDGSAIRQRCLTLREIKLKCILWK